MQMEPHLTCPSKFFWTNHRFSLHRPLVRVIDCIPVSAPSFAESIGRKNEPFTLDRSGLSNIKLHKVEGKF